MPLLLRKQAMATPSIPEERRTRSVKRKRPQIYQSTQADSDSVQSGSDSAQSGTDTTSRVVLHPLKQQSGVVKSCHWSVDEFPISEERKLRRLATLGVVQLFNAVSKHQKSIEDKLKEAGPSERKKHKILSSVDKGGFIDMLKGADDSLKNTAASNTEPAWSILREDYLKNSKLQDWDRDEEANSEGDCSKEGSD